MATTIVPRFDFTAPTPAVGTGQNHTLAKVPNNNLAPEKFNEYERVMCELVDAMGDYGFSTVVPGAEDNVGSVISTIWGNYEVDVPDLQTRMTDAEDDITDLTNTHTNDINSLTATVNSNYTTLNTNKFDKAGGTITGATTIQGALTVSNTISASSLVTFTNGLNVSGATLNANSGLAVGGSATVGTNLTVSGIGQVLGAGGFSVTNGPLVVGSTGSFGSSVGVTGRVTAHSVNIGWASGRNYIVGDVVVYGGIMYVCTVAHTSAGAFAPANWDQAESTPATGTVTESCVDSSFLQEIKTDPVGTIKMFDTNGVETWTDNTTIPGWYACVAANAGLGCPDLVNKFAIGKAAAGVGATGGNASHQITLAVNQLPSHDHTIAHTHDLSNHTHTTDIDHNHANQQFPTSSDGAHDHTVPTRAATSVSPADHVDSGFKSDRDQDLTVVTGTENDHEHTVDVDIAALGATPVVSSTPSSNATGASSAANSGTAGSGNAIDITPHNYSVVFIKRVT